MLRSLKQGGSLEAEDTSPHPMAAFCTRSLTATTKGSVGRAQECQGYIMGAQTPAQTLRVMLLVPSALTVPADTAAILLFSRSLPGYRLYCWVEDGAVKLSLQGSLSFHEGCCTSFFQILW